MYLYFGRVLASFRAFLSPSFERDFCCKGFQSLQFEGYAAAAVEHMALPPKMVLLLQVVCSEVFEIVDSQREDERGAVDRVAVAFLGQFWATFRTSPVWLSINEYWMMSSNSIPST